MTTTPASFDLVVVGGGPAGVTAALRARELGASVAIVERGRLGGTCTDDGCAPTRVLAKAARLMRDGEQLGDYGLVGQRPELDFATLLARTQRIIYQLHEKKQLAAHLERAGAMVVEQAGPAHFVDPNTLELGDDRRLRADRFLLAAGGHARRLAFPGAQMALTHSDVWSLRSLPHSMAVVGAAATGAQLASTFAAFGSRVSLLDTAPLILAGEDELVSSTMRRAFEHRGIEVLTGIDGIDEIEGDSGWLRLVYRIAHERQALDVETVIFAVGWPGNVESLRLEAAGVATSRGYVTVDSRLRTSVPHIYAAGDITGRMMLVQGAAFEARVAAENALGGDGNAEHGVVPHGGFTDPEYASVGLTEEQAVTHEPCISAVVQYGDLDRAVIDGRTDGFAKLVVSSGTHRIVGAHVVGEQAVEVVQIAATVIAAGMRAEHLAELELAYPTFTSILGLAARQAVRELESPRPADRWQALGHGTVAEWEHRDASVADRFVTIHGRSSGTRESK